MEKEQELYLAARDGNLEMIKLLLREGREGKGGEEGREGTINIHYRDSEHGQTALFGAAANGHAAAIRLLYQRVGTYIYTYIYNIYAYIYTYIYIIYIYI
jgi:ankyrin repeat protein